MVSSSVRTMSFLSNQTVSTRREVSTDNRTDEFAKMMDKSINNTKETIRNEKSQADKVEDKPTLKDEAVEDKVYEKVESKEPDDMAVEEKLHTEDVVEDLDEMPEEVSEEILNVIAMILNINVNELKASIEEMGITANDLLDTNSVTELVMNMKNIDSKFDLLVNEDATNAIKDIGQAIEDIIAKMEQSDISKETVIDVNAVDEVVVMEDVEETPQDENVTMKSEGNAENVTENTANMSVSETEARVDTSSQEFNSDGEKDSSKDESKAIDDNAYDVIGDLKGEILNEIEEALSERVDEDIQARIINQITENVTVAVKESVKSLEMQLYPEHLGKVSVLLSSEENGITAKITTETEMAKKAIEQQLTILKDNFDKQGLKVTDIEVTIASHGFEQNLDKESDRGGEQQKRSRGVRRDLLDEVNGISNEEEKENIVMQTLGNTVSYLA